MNEPTPPVSLKVSDNVNFTSIIPPRYNPDIVFRFGGGKAVIRFCVTDDGLIDIQVEGDMTEAATEFLNELGRLVGRDLLKANDE